MESRLLPGVRVLVIQVTELDLDPPDPENPIQLLALPL
jgi:hypothetical protein